MTTEPGSLLEERVRRAIATALHLRAEHAETLPLEMGVTPGWDSMGHMNVVLEIEGELGARFPTYVLPKLVDVASIVRAAGDLARDGGASQAAASVRTVAASNQRLSDYCENPEAALERRGELVRFGPGRVGLGPRLLAMVAALDRMVVETVGCESGTPAPAYAFPSLIGADVLDRIRYFRNFPRALTLVSHLREDEREMEAFARTAGWEGDRLAWEGEALAPVSCVLAPSVCFHWYAALAGRALEEARLITAAGRCFRYESASLDGLERLWDFTMREVIAVGRAGDVASRREGWGRAVQALLEALAMPYQIVTASDPFFIDASAMQVPYQQGFELKLEVMVPLPYCDRMLAVGSINAHQDFFGRSFGIRAGDQPAHTSCIGFGLERLALAFLSQHGVDEQRWPDTMRQRIDACR